MCNDFGNHIPYSDYLAAFSQTRIPVKWPNAAPNLEPRDDIWPTDRAPIIRRLEDGTNEFAEIRWGFPPARPKGTKSPKTKWKFTKDGEPWFCLAGLWRPIPAGGEAFTLLTTDPGADVAPIHDRQMVILERSDWSAWLEQTGNEANLLRALPAGSLNVEQVR